MSDERLPARYDFKTAEPRLQDAWSATRIYEFDSRRPGPVYSVDTPPPTVSGQIHIGHVYSYTHADVVSRYHRMRGEQVFYPFGFDDNGLPTERFTESVTGMRAREVGRRAFVEACLALSAEVEAKFERFWKRLGLSVDWRLRYSTIDPRSRRVSQAAFLDGYEKGSIYRQEAPSLWCPECQTGVAQAELDDRPNVASVMSTIVFGLRDGGEIAIGTTRPELLPACVAIFVHPADARYAALVGKTAVTPIFGVEVPVLADERADPDKGTGAVMCCTFGDVTDVIWWREYHLPLRVAITPDGRMNERAGPYQGLRLKQARARILEDLQAAGLVRERREIEHSVGVHERCGTEIEYLVVGQWFVKILDRKQALLEAGRRMSWFPEYMRARYESWIEGLNWDWNISRQRFYGVPFPVWYCRTCQAVLLAPRERLPVDPQEEPPPLGVCPSCGGAELEPDRDVMDTWATSSLSPWICATLLEPVDGTSPEAFARRYFPMSLRPNAHDIIRTWDFYTVVRALDLLGDIPWTNVMISGHALDPARKKLSKSKLSGAEDPTALLERFSADAVRYWTTSARTGADTMLSEEVFRNGGRLVTKLWNAARLVVPHLDEAPSLAAPEGLNLTDRWLLDALRQTVVRATAAMERYEYSLARQETERFFWEDFCDNYLELVKYRLYGDVEGTGADPTAGRAARYVLREALLAVLKLLAPILPFVTEEIYLAAFSRSDGAESIHLARWPTGDPSWEDVVARARGEALLQVVETVRRWKSDRQVSVATPLELVRVTAPPDLCQTLEGALVDLRSVTRARQVECLPGAAESALAVEVVPEG